MNIRELMTPDGILPKLRASSKKQALQELARAAAEHVDQDERTIFDSLLERERLGSTGLGQGVAIPHARLGGLDRLHLLFARLDQPIGFDAVDDQPVDLLFLLLAPESAGGDHLKALSQISRLLRDNNACRKIRGADSADAIYAVLTASAENQAA